MRDNFAELERLIEEIGHLLEQFDFSEHNDEGNVETVERAKRAVDELDGAVRDLVP